MSTLIIGGGVAGLAAANHLAENGADVTLVEAGSYPCHKVCGEFFSAEALPILNKWELTPETTLKSARFIASDTTFSFTLPECAKSTPRYLFDAALAERARSVGAHILTGKEVEGLTQKKGCWQAQMGSDTLEAKFVIIGTGRLTGQKKPAFPYRGYKAHFEGEASEVLEMHLLPNAYLGVSSVGEGIVNVACLAKACLTKGDCPIDTLLPPSLQGRQLFDWMKVAAPEFGVRDVPNWKNALFVGDAAGTIAPICGGGLTIGLSSGVMAAEHILRGKVDTFRKSWLSCYAEPIKWGGRFHKLALNIPALVTMGKRIPLLLKWAYQKSRISVHVHEGLRFP